MLSRNDEAASAQQ
uniref:Isoform 9 of Leukocyte-specific transcript 1 protein n=1 Tax=Homo sapiens TaxID=9606 RepID=O00453-9|nr:LST-1/N protein [Homo sapiens]